MSRLHSVSRDGYAVCSTVQPKAGRSENIYLLCKVSLLHPPSSLGLDGEGESLSPVVMINRKCIRSPLLRDCQHSRKEEENSFGAVGDPIAHLRRYTREKCQP